MPNEGSLWLGSARRYQSGFAPLPRAHLAGTVVFSPQVHRGLVHVVSADELPTFHGRLLYTPLYSGSFSGFSDCGCRGVAIPDSHSLGSYGVQLLAVSNQIASMASQFMDVIGNIIGAIADILSQIVNFIVNTVMKIVTAILDAVSGLLGSVLDAVGLKGDGSLDPAKAAQLAALLQAKKDTLVGHASDANRPMTPEEKAGYERNLADAQSGIHDLAGGAAKLVAAVGGPVGAVAIGAGLAGMILLSKRKR